MFIPGGFGGYLLIMIVGMLISGAAALWVRSSYSKYSKQRSASGLTGAQTARMILDRNGLSNVRVEPVAGTLTDHYDPRSKVVRLSEDNTGAPPSPGSAWPPTRSGTPSRTPAATCR